MYCMYCVFCLYIICLSYVHCVYCMYCVYYIYVLRVLCVFCILIGQVDLQVTVTDINNNCPIITFTTPMTSFPEQENANDSYFPQDVTTITVTDADGSDTTELTLRIANPSGISTDAFPFVLTAVGPVRGTLVSVCGSICTV